MNEALYLFLQLSVPEMEDTVEFIQQILEDRKEDEKSKQ